MRWAYGITTVPERRHDLLPRTLSSLASAGFPSPRLFIDGEQSHDEAASYEREFKLPITYRTPRIRTHGNWVLSLYELYIREPNAERYALFQDDLVACKNLRSYLEKSPYPENGYCNLYTFPSNQSLAPAQGGWFKGRLLDSGPEGWQTGRGAVALVFSREAVLVLLSSQHIVDRPLDAFRGWRCIDGGVVTAMNKAGWSEYVHDPSLVQHIGMESSMGSRPHKLAESFRGEDFDAALLLPSSSL